jgi:hypothetical protein
MTGGLTSDSNPYLSSGHQSTNDVLLGLSLADTNNKDSTYLKQRFTLSNSTQLSNKANGKFY